MVWLAPKTFHLLLDRRCEAAGLEGPEAAKRPFSLFGIQSPNVIFSLLVGILG